MMKKRLAAMFLTAAMAVSLLAGCGNDKQGGKPTPDADEPSQETGDAGKKEEQGGDSEAGGDGWTGEITFYAQAYTPMEPDDINPNPPTKLKEYAEEYEAAHPGVTISFVELPGDTVMNEYVRTQAAAKQLPDIFFINNQAVAGELPKEMFTSLNDYFNMETPYVEGKTWGETFHPAVLSMMQKGDGQYYTVSADYVETGIYYNKAMFAEAGITELPKNWEEFIEVCKKLKEAGKVPLAWSMAQDDTYAANWTNRVFLSNCYNDEMDTIDFDGVDGISNMEEVVAYKNGVISVDDGKFLSFFEALKELVPYLNDSWSSKSDLERKFMQEEVAMYWTGSWLPKKMVDAGVEFEYGSFPFPTPTENTLPPYTTNAVTSGAVGGPSGGFQYSVSSQQANNTMSQEKLDVVMDWLMYITEPARVSEIVNEYGSFCPTIVGSTPAEGMEGLLDNLNADYTVFNAGQVLTGTISDTMFRNLHQYMLGEITMEQAIDSIKSTMDEEIDILIEDNPEWEIEQYLNQ